MIGTDAETRGAALSHWRIRWAGSGEGEEMRLEREGRLGATEMGRGMIASSLTAGGRDGASLGARRMEGWRRPTNPAGGTPATSRGETSN